MADEDSSGGLPKQELLLSYLLANEDVFATCKHILEPGFFDKELKKVVSYVIDHADEYKILPTLQMVAAETGIELEQVDDADDKRRVKWLTNSVEDFCRRQKTIDAIYNAVESLNDNGSIDVDAIRDATLLSLHRDLGTDVFKNPKDVLKNMLTTGVFSTGFKTIDEILYGGVKPGELNVIIGGPGVGKSWMLKNFALNQAEQGRNVVYISLELTENLIAKRFYGMVSGVASKMIFKNMEKVNDTVLLKAKKLGSIWCKYLPSGSTIDTIASYIRELRIRTGTDFSVICVDYLDLMRPKVKIDLGDHFTKDKYVSEELRSYAIEEELLCFTASQMNRDSINQEDHNQGMIAGGISKVNTADNMGSLYQSQSLRQQHRYLIQWLKTRDSSGQGRKHYLSVDPDTMRFSDMEEEIEEEETKTTKLPSPRIRRGNESERDRLQRIMKQTGR